MPLRSATAMGIRAPTTRRSASGKVAQFESQVDGQFRVNPATSWTVKSSALVLPSCGDSANDILGNPSVVSFTSPAQEALSSGVSEYVALADTCPVSDRGAFRPLSAPGVTEVPLKTKFHAKFTWDAEE